MTQAQLGAAIGRDAKTVRNWENGRTHPRSSIGALEQTLGIDLSDASDRSSPLLEEATEAELISQLAARFARRDAMIRALTARVADLTEQLGSPREVNSDSFARWVARPREDNQEA